ncbi:hypothetical protein HMPREF2946_07185 [Actinomyces sp. HMSC062G12]|nr:hypothetical protein HMPREF2946_07185 [Actinomyces sp. HMSC062G12]
MTIQTAADLAAIIEETGEEARYATIADAVAALSQFLDATEYDLGAIASEACDWYRAYDPEQNVEYLHAQGFYFTVAGDDFWAIVAANKREGEVTED